MNRSIYSILSLSAVVVLALAACSDDDNTSDSTTSTTSSGMGGMATSSSSGMGGDGTGGDGMGGDGMGGDGMGGEGTGGDGGMGAGGMGAGGMGTGGSNNFYFWGDFVTNNVYNVGYFDGTMSSALTLADLDGTDVNAVALSPDGTQLVASGHGAMSTDNLYLYSTSDFTTSTTLVDTIAVGHSVEISEIAFSPDGTLLAFVADIDNNAEDAAYVVPVDGSATATLVSQVPPTGGDVKDLQWVNNTTLAYLGDAITNGIDGLWSVDVTAMTPMPVEIVPAGMLAMGQDLVAGFVGLDSMGRIYFKGDFQTDDLFQLFRVDANGMNLEQVPGTAIMSMGAEASVAGWGISPNGNMLAFGTEPNAGDVGQVYVLDLSMNTATPVTAFTGTPPMGVSWGANFDRINWHPNGNMIGFAGDWPLLMDDVDNSNGAFVATLGATTPVRLMRPAMQTETFSAFNVRFSTDGTSAYIRGDLVNDGEADIFVTSDFATADQDPAGHQVVTSPDNGDVFDIFPSP